MAIVINFLGIREKARSGEYDPTANGEETETLANALNSMILRHERGEILISSIHRQTVRQVRALKDSLYDARRLTSGSSGSDNTMQDTEEWCRVNPNDSERKRLSSHCDLHSDAMSATSAASCNSNDSRASVDSTSSRRIFRLSLGAPSVCSSVDQSACQLAHPDPYDDIEDELQNEILALQLKIEKKKSVLERQVAHKRRIPSQHGSDRFMMHRSAVRSFAGVHRLTHPHRTFTKQLSGKLEPRGKRSHVEPSDESTSIPSSSSDATTENVKLPHLLPRFLERRSFLSDSDSGRSKSEISLVSIDRDGAESVESMASPDRLSETSEDSSRHVRVRQKRFLLRARSKHFGSRSNEPRRQVSRVAGVYTSRQRCDAYYGEPVIRIDTSLLRPVGKAAPDAKACGVEDVPLATEYFMLGDDDEEDGSFCSLENVYENDESVHAIGSSRRYTASDSVCSPSGKSTSRQSPNSSTPRNVCANSSTPRHLIANSSTMSPRRSCANFHEAPAPAVSPCESLPVPVTEEYARSSIPDEFYIQFTEIMSRSICLGPNMSDAAPKKQAWCLRHTKIRAFFHE